MKSRQELENIYADPAHGSSWCVVDGTRVHYRFINKDDSSKPILVLIHGILDSLHSWQDWVNLLKDEFRILIFDVPGFGLTFPVRIEQYQRYTYAHFLKAFLDELNIKEKVFLSGNSLGGFISWTFSFCYPDRVHAFAVTSPAAYPLKVPPIPVLVANLPGLPFLSRKLLNRKIYDKIARRIYFDGKQMSEENLERGFRMMAMEGADSFYNKVFKDMTYFIRGYPHEISDLNTAGLVIWGDTDRLIPTKQIELWKRDNPNLSYSILEKCGHIPHGEKPRESAELLIKFFKPIKEKL